MFAGFNQLLLTKTHTHPSYCFSCSGLRTEQSFTGTLCVVMEVQKCVVLSYAFLKQRL